MQGLLDFHGRLSRSDKRPANPGSYCLQFQLHGQARASQRDKVYWEEVHESVDIAPGGFYQVVLGRKIPLDGTMFSRGARWMSVRVVRAGKLDDENNNRIPVVGNAFSLAKSLNKTNDRVNSLEQRVEDVASSSPKVDQFQTRLNRIVESLEVLAGRLVPLEDGAEVKAVVRRLESLTGRLDEVDKDEGRLDRLELEMEDIIGPDGDVVDLNERMDRVEGQAPDLIRSLRQREKNRPEPVSVDDLQQKIVAMEAQLSAMMQLLNEVSAKASAAPKLDEVSPAKLGVVNRNGDTMTGGLTINRGGLEVVSGGLVCRGATVTTLEASNVVKTPKMLVDAMELRGDFTVDSASRSMQVRMIEGRQASARRDGALHLNSRGGAEVVVGNEKASKGAQVHGAVRADSLVSYGTGGLAQVFNATGALSSGDVVRVNDAGERVVRVRKLGDCRVMGVITDAPGIVLGGESRTGVVVVAVSGVVSCRVEAHERPIRAGDLLIASGESGHARSAEDPDTGSVLGKALAPLEKGTGVIPVLLGVR